MTLPDKESKPLKVPSCCQWRHNELCCRSAFKSTGTGCTTTSWNDARNWDGGRKKKQLPKRLPICAGPGPSSELLQNSPDTSQASECINGFSSGTVFQYPGDMSRKIWAHPAQIHSAGCARADELNWVGLSFGSWVEADNAILKAFIWATDVLSGLERSWILVWELVAAMVLQWAPHRLSKLWVSEKELI